MRSKRPRSCLVASSRSDCAASTRLSPSQPGSLSAADLSDAGSRLELLPLEASMRYTLTAEILAAGLALLRAGMTGTNARLLDCELTDKDLRLGLGRSYRGLARLFASQSDRYSLIDLANGVRPRTLT